MKKIYYIGYYSDPDDIKERKTAPAADTKTSYILSCLKRLGYEIEVLSWCSPNSRKKIWKKYDGYLTKINGIKVRFFDAYSSKFRLLRVIGRWIQWNQRRKYIINNCLDNNSQIIIYHSLAFLNLMKFLSSKNKDFILEMEEIYADVIENRLIRNDEINIAKNASGFIFPTPLLNDAINNENKPMVIVHGTYQVEPDRKNQVFDNEHIHCVYAGTFDPRKGCCAAAEAAKLLPANYHIHIIGFGNKQDIENLKKLVSEISEKSTAKLTYDGLKSGEEYIKFIQSCDIGLCTQDPDSAFNLTSFPSKVLSYLANGLRVVSIKIPAIEESAVGDMLFYYEKQTPEEIAKAIQSIDLQEVYNSRTRIIELDNQFRNDLKDVLEGEN